MKRNLAIIILFLLSLQVSFAQSKQPLPIIDMHLHSIGINDNGPAPVNVGAPFKNFGSHDPGKPYAPNFIRILKTDSLFEYTITSPATDDDLMNESIFILNKRNIHAVTSGDIMRVRKWKLAEPKRIIPAVMFSFGDTLSQKLSVDSLRSLFQSKEFKVFGEIVLQYGGYSASDPAFEPFLKMAEELDVPVGIHIGLGPPGIGSLPPGSFKASLCSALNLEEALKRHPKLRVYVMHAGWPMLDDMLALLYVYPQVYVDVGIIDYILPRKEFYHYLQRLVEAGFGKRIMFGSDQMVWPKAIEIAIKNIEAATFLSQEQKRDIFFNNAARFLRLTEKEINDMKK
ncbi:MAG: amidohydrolase [Chitinophagaceae bacterium]|nr:MAG: amidohydrolase [Chitinophagaceae bacterium]